MNEHIKWIIQTIITAGTLIAAISAIAKPIGSALKAQREYQERTAKWREHVDSTLETLQRHQSETWLATLRQEVFSSNLPLTERINAGESYIANGGNGTAKVQHEHNVNEFRARRGKEGGV